MTLRDHLASVAATIPEAAEDLFGPPLPPYCDRAWELFWQLNATRAATSAGPQAIPYGEIDAFQRVTRQRLTPLEVLLVREADDALLHEMRHRVSSHNPPAPE